MTKVKQFQDTSKSLTDTNEYDKSVAGMIHNIYYNALILNRTSQSDSILEYVTDTISEYAYSALTMIKNHPGQKIHNKPDKDLAYYVRNIIEESDKLQFLENQHPEILYIRHTIQKVNFELFGNPLL